MRTKDVVWSNDRAALTIQNGGGRQLGNCYSSSDYIVTTTQPLDQEQLKTLNRTGFLGYGQEFYIRGQKIDGQLVPVPQKLTWETRRDVKPSGVDKVPPRVYDRHTGEQLNEQPVNQYTGNPITEEHPYPFFIYVVESRVDSSD